MIFFITINPYKLRHYKYFQKKDKFKAILVGKINKNALYLHPHSRN